MRKPHLYIPVILFGLILCSSPISASFTDHMYPISLSGFAPYYLPSLAKVPAGRPILWINATASPHTITHDDCIGNAPCAFDSGGLKGSAVFSLYSLRPGIYPYHCRLHPIMRGTLIVMEPGDSPAPENHSSTHYGVR
jgi:plastocyanin